MQPRGLAIAVVLLLMPSFCPASGEEVREIDREAFRIIEEVDRSMGLADIKSTQKMTVYRKDGTVRVYVMEVMTSGDDKAFAEILDPPREKGRQMLKLGEVVWSYLPSVKKSIRVSGRSRFMGGDFENNDILRLNLVDDYIPRLVGEPPGQYVLELEGRDLGLAYARVKLWVSKDSLLPLRQEYYAINGELVKSSVYGSVTDFGGLKRPAVIEMRSALSPKKKTILEIVDLIKGAENPETVFRRSNLGK